MTAGAAGEHAPAAGRSGGPPVLPARWSAPVGPAGVRHLTSVRGTDVRKGAAAARPADCWIIPSKV
ncbi:hypothetical protein Saso_36140 [Streptomyces asoensis]|uniref:Uncharacterized protein n=1 Tax=Streptomyces asoensis TaxID=249586 RepID=A0ABQ3S1H5_9ACTN|nr:hypothetical protein GCM10010496_43830 [Streptomyces asoensis]GHI61964.1 hypothetical protein Saso_36140 [Streptomyces asoensis]